MQVNYNMEGQLHRTFISECNGLCFYAGKVLRYTLPITEADLS